MGERDRVPAGRAQLLQCPVGPRAHISRPLPSRAPIAPQHPVGIVQLVGRPGTPNIEVMSDDIDTARAFAEELSAALKLELISVPVPGQTIRRYTM